MAELIPFRRPLPAPKAPRLTAQIVPIPGMSFRPLGQNLDAASMARRLHSRLLAKDKNGAAKAWRAHVAQIEARAKGVFTPEEFARMRDAYRDAVRREIDALKAGE